MQTKHFKKTPLTSAVNFTGFDQWFAIFKGGEQIDSQGNAKTWTNDDLDSIVKNFDAEESAPFTIGHTTDKSPAWGWVDALKRDGNTLFAKGRDVVDEFSDLVKNKQFPKRSIGLSKHDQGGFNLDHVAFLGAKAPAVKGLGHIYNATDGVVCYEFAYSDDIHPIKSVMRSLREMVTRWRELIIEQDGIDAADKVLPGWELEHADRMIDQIGEERNDKALYKETDTSSHIESNLNEDVTVIPSEKEKQLQKELDAANAENAQLKNEQSANAFATRKVAAQTKIDQLLDDGKLMPVNVQGEGLANFMANLPDDDNSMLEFSAPDGKPKTATPAEYFNQFISSLGVQVKTGKHDDDEPDEMPHSYSAPDDSRVDPDRAALHEKIKTYQAAHDGVDYTTAAIAVEKGEL